MIKWFDADRFLPGRECSSVLVRYRHNEMFGYEMACFYSENGSWQTNDGEDIESDNISITHWAFIEEPI